MAAFTFAQCFYFSDSVSVHIYRFICMQYSFCTVARRARGSRSGKTSRFSELVVKW